MSQDNSSDLEKGLDESQKPTLDLELDVPRDFILTDSLFRTYFGCGIDTQGSYYNTNL